MTKLTWLSHGGWMIENDNHRLLIDPFLTDNPAALTSADQLKNVDHILISHGHFDHVADAASIANENNATIVAIYEIAGMVCQTQNVQSTVGMNIGGQLELPWGSVKMTPAFHSSQLPDGSYGGEPAGFVVKIDGTRIYFACDTALFGDMKLYADKVDIAVLPHWRSVQRVLKTVHSSQAHQRQEGFASTLRDLATHCPRCKPLGRPD